MDDGGASNPQSDARLSWFGLVVLLGVLAVAASTDSVDIWQSPESSEGQRPVPTTIGDDIAVPVIAEPLESDPSVVGLVLVILLVLVALVLLKPRIGLSPLADLFDRRFGWSQLKRAEQKPLPEVTVHDFSDEVSEARHALLDGDARNGIVACWMRLERSAQDVGLPRVASETAEEYSQRMAISTSVDPAPLDELAELYREARFSDHRLGEQHRERAAAALGRISDELDADIEVDEVVSP